MEDSQNTIKKKAAIENKDTSNAVYDESEHRIVDIDDILMGDSTIAKKFRNLSQYGITEDQIKKLYSMVGNLSSGDSIEAALEELEKVFTILVTNINNAPNGLVIDLFTGKEDVVLSKLQCKELNIEYGSYQDKTLQEKVNDIEEIISIFKEEPLKSFSNLNTYIEILSAEGMFDSTFYSRSYTEEDYQKARDIIGTTDKEEEKSENDVAQTTLDSLEDVTVIEAVYELTTTLEKKIPNDKKEEAIKKFRETLAKNQGSKYYQLLKGNNDEINSEDVKKFKEDWQDKRNISDLAIDLERYVVCDKFDELSKWDQEKIILAVAKATKYADKNSYVEKILTVFEKNFNLDTSKDGIKKSIYEITGVKIETDEELDKFIEKDEINDKTIGYKLEQIREAIKEDTEKGSETEKNESAKSKRHKQKEKYFNRTVQAREIYQLFSKKFKDNSENSKDYSPIEIIMLYKKFHEEKNNTMENIIGRYVVENIEIFDKYFKENGYFNREQDSTLLTTKGIVSINTVNKVLGNVMLPESTKGEVDDLTEALKEINKKNLERENAEEKNIEKLYSLINNPKEFTPKKEDAALKILSNIDRAAITETLVKQLTKLKSSKIEEQLDKMLTREDYMESIKQINSEENVKNEKIEKNVLLIEAKVELAKGTPDYANVLAYRKKYYEENPLAQRKAAKIRNMEGKLTEKGKKHVEDYTNELVNKNLKHIIEETDINSLSEDEKKVFTTFLIAGFEDNSLDTKIAAIEKLKTMYASLALTIDNKEFRKIMYSKVYGDNLELDESTIEQKSKEIRANVIYKIIKEKEPIEIIEKGNSNNSKIGDQEVKVMYEDKMVELNTSSIDLTQSELKNLFRDSKINFTDRNEKTYEDSYSKSTIASWVGKKEDVLKYKLLSLVQIRENMKKSGGKYLGFTKQKVIDHQIEILLKKHPEVKEKYVKDGKISKELMNEGRRFNENKIYSKILERFSKDILTNASNYENLKKGDKVEFLRYILLARKYSEISDDPEKKDLLLKLSNRGLELMNTDETKYITFDNNGNGKINEEAITKEYNEVSMQRMRKENFDGIKEFIYQRESLLYVYKKMREYSEKKDIDFKELKSKDPKEQMAEIEQTKLAKNQEYEVERKRVKGENVKELKEKNNTIEDFSEDRAQQNPSEIQEDSRKRDNLEANLSEVKNEKGKQEIPETSEDIDVKKNKGIIGKIKNFLKKAKQPRLTDGSENQPTKNGLISKISSKIKGLNSKKEDKNISTFIKDSADVEFKKTDWNESLKVQDYKHPNLAENNFSKSTDIKNREDALQENEEISL